MAKIKSVSVVIPSYNRSGFIEQCIASVFNQEVGDRVVECVVVDDHSTDDSVDVLNRLRAEYGSKLVVHMNDQNKQKSRSRNTGAQLASGDLICFLDSDDELTPGSLKARAQEFDAGFQGVLFSLTDRPNGQSQMFESKIYTLSDFLAHPNILSNNCYMLPTRLFLEVGGYPEFLTNMEDRYLFSLLLKKYPAIGLNVVTNKTNRIDVSAQTQYRLLLDQQFDFYEHLEATGLFNTEELQQLLFWNKKEMLIAAYREGSFSQYVEVFKSLTAIEKSWLPSIQRFRKRYLVSWVRRFFC